MKEEREKNYIRLILLVSILFGIILPLVLGIKDLTYIAIFFTSVCMGSLHYYKVGLPFSSVQS
jgi:hypothetical protein